MSNKKTIGFIGLGNMGYAIYRGVGSEFDCIAYDPYPRKDEDLNYVSSFKDLEEKSDYLILCVKPVMVQSVLKEISKPVNLISIAAGISLDSLKKNLPTGSKIVRTMPNLPLMVRQGCLGYFGDESLYSIVKEIFHPMGFLLSLPREDMIDAVTGLSGSGPAFVFSFIHAMAEGGVKSGLSYSDSLNLTLQTIKGSVEYFQKEKEKNPNLHPAELRNRVTSPAGTTIYGLAEWEKSSVSSGISESVFSAFKRSQELG